MDVVACLLSLKRHFKRDEAGVFEEEVGVSV